jgi:hypothetical protein
MAISMSSNSPDWPSILVLASDERLTVQAFATVIGDRMEVAGSCVTERSLSRFA